MTIKLSEKKRLVIFKGETKTVIVDRYYWWFKIPFTKIVLHYYKLPF